MTKEQKLEWPAVTPQQLMDQLSSMASIMDTGDLVSRIKAEEDYRLTEAEILKRRG